MFRPVLLGMHVVCACGERSPCAPKERVTQLLRAECALAVALAASRAGVLAGVPCGQSRVVTSMMASLPTSLRFVSAGILRVEALAHGNKETF